MKITDFIDCKTIEKHTIIYPTVTTQMPNPIPELRERWFKKYGKGYFTFKEALYAQSFPSHWRFPPLERKRWKWLAEAFPPKVSEYLFRRYVHDNNNVLLDLFAGIGGWSLGAIWAQKVSKIIMVEVDGEKCLYLKENFSTFNVKVEVICDDVRNVDYESLGRIDVVTASPPCEDLTYLRNIMQISKKKKGTIPLTKFTINLVEKINPKTAFYENIYRKILAEYLSRHGWHVMRFDMSKIIPQKRIRLIAVRSTKRKK